MNNPHIEIGENRPLLCGDTKKVAEVRDEAMKEASIRVRTQEVIGGGVDDHIAVVLVINIESWFLRA